MSDGKNLGDRLSRRLFRWVFGEIRYPSDPAFQRRFDALSTIGVVGAICGELLLAASFLTGPDSGATTPLRTAAACCAAVVIVILARLTGWAARYGSRFGRPFGG